MLKMTDSYLQQRQVSQFQDLFVQRHSNVRHKSEQRNFDLNYAKCKQKS